MLIVIFTLFKNDQKLNFWKILDTYQYKYILNMKITLNILTSNEVQVETT